MNRTRVLVAGAVIAAGSAGAQPLGDVERGREMAARYCEACHDISASGPDKLHPPSFAAIARFRPVEQIRARIWFPPFHASMPQFADIMAPSDVEHLTAYIQSLE